MFPSRVLRAFANIAVGFSTGNRNSNFGFAMCAQGLLKAGMQIRNADLQSDIARPFPAGRSACSCARGLASQSCGEVAGRYWIRCGGRMPRFGYWVNGFEFHHLATSRPVPQAWQLKGESMQTGTSRSISHEPRQRDFITSGSLRPKCRKSVAVEGRI